MPAATNDVNPGPAESQSDNPVAVYSDNGSGTAAQALVTTQTLTVPGTFLAPGTAGNNIIGVESTVTGTVDTGVNYAPVQIDITYTNFTRPVSDRTAPAMIVNNHFGGLGDTGSFTGIAGYIHHTDQTGNLAAGFSSQYIAGRFGAFSAANEGGVTGAGNGVGSLYGINPTAQLSSGATFWAQCVGAEINTSVKTGASVGETIGAQIVQSASDAVAGSIADYALSLNNQSGAKGWDYGLVFGNYTGRFPMKSTGTLIGAWAQGASPNSGNVGTTTNGVDLSNVTFTGSAYKSNGFSVDGSGNVTATSFIGPVSASTNVPVVQWSWGLPVIMPSSGSMGNNGAITLTIALPAIYPACYLVLPAGAIATGVPTVPTVYYAVMSSTTVGQVFNNTLASGKPTIPASPTAFVTTGPGAYSSATSAQVLLTLPIPGNTLGTQGSLVVDLYGLRVSNAGAMLLTTLYGGSNMGQMNTVSTQWYGFHRTMRNIGATNSQMFLGSSSNAASDTAAVNAAPTFTAVDSTASQNLVIKATLTVATTDYFVLTGGTITSVYSA